MKVILSVVEMLNLQFYTCNLFFRHIKLYQASYFVTQPYKEQKIQHYFQEVRASNIKGLAQGDEF